MKEKGSWLISSFSGGGDSCVAARDDDNGNVQVAHSKRLDAAQIDFTPAEWQAFIRGVKAGEFDHLGRLV